MKFQSLLYSGGTCFSNEAHKTICFVCLFVCVFFHSIIVPLENGKDSYQHFAIADAKWCTHRDAVRFN